MPPPDHLPLNEVRVHNQLINAANGKLAEVESALVTLGVDAFSTEETERFTPEYSTGMDLLFHNDLVSFPKNTTALMAAATCGRKSVIVGLLQHGADANMKNANGRNALCLLLLSKKHGLATEDLDQIASDLAKATDYNKTTFLCLQLAATLGLSSTLKVLYAQKKAADDARFFQEDVAYRNALLSKSAAAVTVFVENYPGYIGTVQGTKVNFLEFAAANSSAEIIWVLLKAYLEKHEITNKILHGMHRRSLARDDFDAVFTKKDLIKFMDLLNDDSSSDDDAREKKIVQCDADGVPLIFYAVGSGSLMAISAMVEHGYDPHITYNGVNVISVALDIKDESKCLPVLQLLVEQYKVDVDVWANSRLKPHPLIKATISAIPEVVEYLAGKTKAICAVCKITDTQMLEGSQTTALIEACKKPGTNLAPYIKAGADILQEVKEIIVDPKDEGDRIEVSLSALRVALLFNNIDAFTYLLRQVTGDATIIDYVHIDLGEMTVVPSDAAAKEAARMHLDAPFFTLQGLETNAFVQLYTLRVPGHHEDNLESTKLAIAQALVSLGCTSYGDTVRGYPVAAHAVIESQPQQLKHLLRLLPSESLTQKFEYKYKEGHSYDNFPFEPPTGSTITVSANILTLAVMESIYHVRATAALDVLMGTKLLSPLQKAEMLNGPLGSKGTTLLMLYMQRRNAFLHLDFGLPLIKDLIQAGAKTSAVDADGNTAFYFMRKNPDFHDRSASVKKACDSLLQPPQQRRGLIWCCLPKAAAPATVEQPREHVGSRPSVNT